MVPTVVPFGGLFSTAPDSVDRQDVFAERGFIFSGQSGEITNWQTIGRSIDAVSNKFVSFSQNLSGAAVSTGRSFNSVMTGLFRFRDGETDRNGNTNQTLVDFFEIYSDVAPLVDAFCSDPRYSINSASSSSSDESSSDEDEASLEPVCANV